MGVTMYWEMNKDGSRTCILVNTELMINNFMEQGHSEEESIDLVNQLEGKTVILKDNKFEKIMEI